MGLLVDQLALASPAAYVPVDGGHDKVPAVIQLPEFVAGCLPDFGETAHGLRNRDNMKHWTVHQDEFFDYYLLGKPKPVWMEKGVPYLEKGKRDVSVFYKKSTDEK